MRVLAPLEKTIERAFVRKIRDRLPGVLVRKMNGEGYRSWPDRMVCLPSGRVFFLEFKRPGGTLTPDQCALHEDLRQLGHDVATYDDAEKAFRAVEARYRA